MLRNEYRRQGQRSMEQQETLRAQIEALGVGGRRVEGAVAQLVDHQAGIGNTILRAVGSRTKPDEQGNTYDLHEGVVSALYKDSSDGISTNLPTPHVPIERKKHLQNVFLSQLRYHDMEDREGRIANPYEDTFRWIFVEDFSRSASSSNFKEWLESESKLYWITGKAGSGKSTLIKFICQILDDQAASSNNKSVAVEAKVPRHDYLGKWAGGLRLVLATFYFWNSGVELQMSQLGLLRSLLFQILQQIPEIIGTIASLRWESLCFFNEDSLVWTSSELHRMLLMAVNEISKTMKICFFIDGLDEFEGEKDNLICLITEIITYENVKACVASRPWVEFQDAFGHEPNLMLQDLTYLDIKHFVASSLQQDTNFSQLRKREEVYADQLVENIVTKSSGVFLWVSLVVRSLLTGMNNGDRVIDLQRRLDLLPPDLEKLYDKILENLDPFYLEHAAQLFKMVEVSPQPTTALVLYYADEMDLASVIKNPLKIVTAGDEALKVDTMQRRLNSRCRGLLEVSPESVGSRDRAVQYLHRTVKDYIQSTRAQITLRISSESSFNPYQSFCAGHLARMKTREELREFEWNERFWQSAEQCIWFAARMQEDNPDLTISVADQLFEQGNTALKSSYIFPRMADHWDEDVRANIVAGKDIIYVGKRKVVRETEDPYKPYKSDVDFKTDFLSLALYQGLVEFVASRGSADLHVNSRLLLDTVVCFQMRKKPKQLVRVMQSLLSNKADPNHKSQSPFTGDHSATSAWFQVLNSVLEEEDDPRKIPDGWQEVVKLMIQHGAAREEDLLCWYDPYLYRQAESDTLVLVRKPWKTPMTTFKSIFKKDRMRISEVFKPYEDRRGPYWHVADEVWGSPKRKFALYDQIQEIRGQTKIMRR